MSFYPYSFSLNEQIRELAGLAVASSYWRKIDLKEEIKSFEQNFKTDRPDIYTIVLYDKATIYYKSGAHALGERFILKINDEKAIERFQRYNVGGFDYMDVVIQDAQTIKKMEKNWMLNSTAEKWFLPILKLEITYIVHISTNRVMALNLLNSIVKFGDQIVLYLLIKHHRPFF